MRIKKPLSAEKEQPQRTSELELACTRHDHGWQLEHTLVNNGVAEVKDDRSLASLETLNYELKTFVCGDKAGDQINDHYLSLKEKQDARVKLPS